MFVLGTEGVRVHFGEGVEGKRLVSAGSLMMIEITYEEQAVAQTHAHENNESITYVKQGRLEVQVGEHTQVLTAGDTFYVPKGVAHSARALSRAVTVDVFTPIREELI